jgi:hypothetical protein
MAGFWLEGYVSRRRMLRQEYEKRLGDLRNQLRLTSSGDARADIKKKMREEHASYKRNLEQLNRSFY